MIPVFLHPGKEALLVFPTGFLLLPDKGADFVVRAILVIFISFVNRKLQKKTDIYHSCCRSAGREGCLHRHFLRGRAALRAAGTVRPGAVLRGGAAVPGSGNAFRPEKQFPGGSPAWFSVTAVPVYRVLSAEGTRKQGTGAKLPPQ